MINPETSAENLAKLSDPNRGRIVGVGLSKDRAHLRLFTGMGGRSVGSKNRVYKEFPDLNGNGNYVRTAVFDSSIQTGDSSATLYIAQRSWRGWHVASNGEQTDGIGVALAAGCPFEGAQAVYENEGKDNGFTARVTATVYESGGPAYLGKIVSMAGEPEESTYHTYKLHLIRGELYFTSTYDGKGGLEPNREDPWVVRMEGSLEDTMDILWEAWDPNTRANLCGKEIERGSGRFRYTFRSIHQNS